MSVVLLDPRFPAMIPVEAIPLLSGDVAYTEEVPVRVRWTILDLGGHTDDDADVLVTTDVSNPLVRERLDAGKQLITAPSLLVEMEPQRQLEGSDSSSSVSDATSAQAGAAAAKAQGAAGAAGPQMPSAAAVKGDFSKPGEKPADEGADGTSVSGDGYVDGQIVGSDEHTAAVAGMRRTTRTEVPASVMDEIEDAVALMARALRQGEWEQGMTHASLVKFLREETEELARVIDAVESKGTEVPQWLEQELCKELSDVLLQVLFHAEIANRRGAFDIGHVAGAFTAKLQSRAPYLFESVERQVPKTEQDRLWEEGKKRERAEREQSLGKEYTDLVDAKERAAQGSESSAQDAQGDSPTGEGAAPQSTSGKHSAKHSAEGQASVPVQRIEPHASTFAAQKPASEGGTSAAGNGNAVADSGASGLQAAEEVIREARELGIADTDIPMDIRYPMVGLEMDKPGEADRRLKDAVANFREVLKNESQK
ncbi:MazG nucleotide pyrophosphohydrolase domain-containing protein [Corynebacterium urogenitale]